MGQDDAALELARKHVKKVRDFFYHLMVFVLLNTLMIILDRRGGEGEQAVFGLDWAYWLIIFWGFGIVGHAISAFLGEHRAQRLYKQESNRDRPGR